jgi:hypothetical protein
LISFTVNRNSLPLAPKVAIGNIIHQSVVAQPRSKFIKLAATATFVAAINPVASNAFESVKPASIDSKEFFRVFEFSQTSTVSDDPLHRVSHSSETQLAMNRHWITGADKNSWTHSASERISELSKRPKGWKGEGSLPPSISTVQDALAMIRRIYAEGYSTAPLIGVEEDGSLIFFWKSPSVLLSFSIEGQGKYGFFLEIDHSNQLDDDVLISNPFPKVVALALLRIDAERV